MTISDTHVLTVPCPHCTLPLLEATTGDGQHVLLDPRIKVYRLAGQHQSGEPLALMVENTVCAVHVCGARP